MLRTRLFAALTLLLVLNLPAIPQVAGRHSGTEKATASQPLVDINHASLEELLRVPGLTRGWAQRIMRFRPYRSKLDLFEEGVLPGWMYYSIRNYIVAHRQPE
ncbi:MAG TPA: helix-hairpin-helix domain-containing protein [Terracidiphilus sp.]